MYNTTSMVVFDKYAYNIYYSLFGKLKMRYINFIINRCEINLKLT